MNMTTRRQRRSTSPLSFYGIKFKTSAPAKPLSESTQQEESHPLDRITNPEPRESIGKNTPDTERA
jgi:hypothetical protein